MDRKQLFTTALGDHFIGAWSQAPRRPGSGPQVCTPDDYLKEIKGAVANAGDTFANFYDDPNAMKQVLRSFEIILQCCTSAMCEYGAFSRDTGALIGNDAEAAFTAIDEERKYQELRPVFNKAAARHFTLIEELVLIQSCLRAEAEFRPFSENSQQATMNAIREVAAMAMRGYENPRL